ncbi:MAG: hypothetical protein KGY50_00685 [Candidatus Thermoplasmatota archaeon]|nr:hypothetical protein [Candidatus Thermoplasmatota archaeon]
MKGEKRERILRIVLDNPSGNLTAYAIHKKAECSQPWALTYLKKLERMNFVKKTKVIDVYGLFHYWLNIRSSLKYAEYHLKKDPLQIIKKSKLPYALTTYQADKLIHNYLFPTRTDFYILKKDVDSWHNTLVSHGLVGKGNTKIIIADPHIINHSNQRNGYSIVSTSQLICDLLMEGGVAVDAAQRLIRKWYADFI